MAEQYNSQEFIQTLVQEIYSLKNEVALLKNELNTSRVSNADLTNRLVKLELYIEQTKSVQKIFNKNNFMNNSTVEYLSVCKLDRDALCELLNMLPKLDFPCVKYLIDLWAKGLYKWNETFSDYLPNTPDKMLIHFLCKYGCEEAVLYMLDICTEKNFDLECETNCKWKPIHFLCKHGTPQTINRILDIYLEKNLDLECENNIGWKPIHILCRYKTPQTIKRIMDIYVEKRLSCQIDTIKTYMRGNQCLSRSQTLIDHNVMCMYFKSQYMDFYK